MEDVIRVVPALGGDETMSYFGVYDGHGGRHIAEFLEETLENNISEELKVDDDASIPERMARAYLITDAMSKKDGIMTSGATAVSALLHNSPEGKKLYVSNVGDSRAVLCSPIDENGNSVDTCSGYLARRLSHDHTADDPGEQERVKECGGFITRGRVLGILAVTRSFGDHGMKDFVVAAPHQSEVNLSACDQPFPFLILACDGVWDVMSDQEAVDMLMEEFVSKGGPFDNAAEMLVETAVDRGTSDNVSAVVVFF